MTRRTGDRHAGQPVSKVLADAERNYYMSAEEAKAYGLVDEIISFRKAVDPLNTTGAKK